VDDLKEHVSIDNLLNFVAYCSNSLSLSLDSEFTIDSLLLFNLLEEGVECLELLQLKTDF